MFWSLTLREIDVILSGASDRINRERKMTAWLAWHTSALGRAKRFPSFNRFVDPSGPGRRPGAAQTQAQIKNTVKQWMADSRPRA